MEFANRIRITLLKAVNGKGVAKHEVTKATNSGRFVMIHSRNTRQLCDPTPSALFEYGVLEFTSEISDFIDSSLSVY